MNLKPIIICYFLTGILIWSGLLKAQQINEFLDMPVFNKLTGDDGLSQGRISDIAQDKSGFMWFATRDGLNRWDGYSMEIFKNNPENPNTILSNIIDKIVVDSKGQLWILTEAGICVFNPRTERFSPLKISDQIDSLKVFDFSFDNKGKLLLATQSNGLLEIDTATRKLTAYNIFNPYGKNNDIRLVFADSENRIWVSLRHSGIQLLERETGKITQFQKEPNSSFDINQHYITSIVEDKNGNLWFGSGDVGLVFLDTRTMHFNNYKYLENGEYVYGRSILDLAFQDDKHLWVGSDSEGLVCFNIDDFSFSQYSEGETENNLLYRTINSLFFDTSGNLWIGTNGNGLNILSPYSKKFFTIGKASLTGLNLSFQSVRAIYEDNNHILWVGGYSGLQRIDFEKKSSKMILSDVVYTICPDPVDENILWLGTEGLGMFGFDKRNNKKIHIPIYDEYSDVQFTNKMLHGTRVYDIVAVSPHELYIATAQGLNIFNSRNQTFRFIKIDGPDPSFMRESGLTTIYKDSKNQLWLGSFTGGLLKMNADLNTAKNFSNSPEKPDLPGNRVNCIYEDSKDRFWIATNMGLCLMNRDVESFVTYTEADGLPNNTVYGILEDNDGDLWLSTNNGISKFNPDNLTFRNYNKPDGLPGNEFNSAAYFQYNKSRLYFGGLDGLVVFNPDNVVADENPPVMDFTRIKIITRNTLLNINLTDKKEVILDPGVVLVEIEFSAFNFINPADCKYAYQFGPNAKDWIELGNKRTITLTKPNHGDYYINIKASNSDGIWNDHPKTLKISVLPRFTQTLFFKVLIALLILSIIGSVFYLRYTVNKNRQKKLQLLIEQRTKELRITNDELNRANASKDKFFSIIAHDLKNPFNSLLGFTDLLVTDWREMEDDEKLNIVTHLKSTIENTYELLINLLEWSQIQRKKIVWNPEIFNLPEIINDILSQLSTITTLKNITFEVQVDQQLMVYSDINMFSGIMRNLVGNAIKFTHPGGRIIVKARHENENFVVCQVQDNGVGMTSEKIEQIFHEEFTQSTAGTEGEQGTGLGLALCREFVSQHGGKIWAESIPNRGSSFFFTMPVRKIIADNKV